MQNPHAGRELELTILGVKPFCFLDIHVYPKQFQQALLLAGEHSVVSRGRGMVTVCRKENAHLQGRYNLIRDTTYKCVADKHRAYGELFGYKKSEIEAFVASSFKCDCQHCKSD